MHFIRKNIFICFSLHFFILVIFFLKIFIGSSPVFVKYKGESQFLLYSDDPKKGSMLMEDLLIQHYDWNTLTYDKVVWPIIRLSDQKYHTDQAWRQPLSSDSNRFHFLGTYELGRDVFVSILYGMQKSILIAFISVLLASLIGLPIGIYSAYFSIKGIYLNVIQTIVLFLLSLFLLYGILLGSELKNSFTLFSLLLFIASISIILKFNRNRNGKLRLNPDFFLMRGIELMKSLPLLLVLLILLQWFKKPDLVSLSILIAIFLSVSIAKYSRFISISEMKESHMISLQALAYSNQRIIFNHLLPKVFFSIAPLLALSLSSVILLEASISFLGLGLSVEDISLGNMMYSARNYPSCWWVVLFPGLCVFWLVYCFQSLNTLLATNQQFENAY